MDYSRFSDLDWQRIKAHYYGKISLIDKNIGRILKALGHKSHLDDTVLVLTTDHGEHLGDHWLIGKYYPYDEIIRVPCILSWPGRVPCGLSIDSLTQQVDIFPTLCEIIGFPAPECVQGKSLVPLMKDPRKEIYEEVLVETGGLTVRNKDWRFTVHPEGWSELYNLREDPNEFHNLYHEQRYCREKEKLMERLVIRMRQALPVPKPEAIW